MPIPIYAKILSLSDKIDKNSAEIAKLSTRLNAADKRSDTHRCLTGRPQLTL